MTHIHHIHSYTYIIYYIYHIHSYRYIIYYIYIILHNLLLLLHITQKVSNVDLHEFKTHFFYVSK